MRLSSGYTASGTATAAACPRCGSTCINPDRPQIDYDLTGVELSCYCDDCNASFILMFDIRGFREFERHDTSTET